MDEPRNDAYPPATDRIALDPAESDGNNGPTESAILGEALPERLEHVIDDTQGRDAAVEWTMRQLLAGMSFELAATELTSQGWAAASADSIVEEAREATRKQRGIRTRDDVVVGVYRKFGKTMRRVRWLIIIGVVVVIIAISMFVSRGG